MSKASEWAAAPVKGKRLDLVDSTGRLIALVSNEPRMGMGYRRWLSPAEALRLAAWIIDTFSEPDRGHDPSCICAGCTIG